MLWRIESVGRFFDANEDSVVYFDPFSGDTHLLSAFAAFLIRQFSDRPLSTEELASLLSPHLDSNDEVELLEAVSGVLEELLALDILQLA